MRLAHVAFSLAFAAASLARSSALAFEKQWHAGGSLGLARMSHGDGAAIGPAADLALTFGLSDQFNLLGEVTLATARLNPTAPAVLPGHYELLAGQVGIAYTLDVLRWVPYVGVLGGGGRLASGNTLGASVFGKNSIDYGLALTLAGGLDYQATRELSVGAALRYHMFRTTDSTSLFGMMVRAQYTWGY